MPSTYEKIEARTLGSNTTTVTLSSIPATYTDLVMIVAAPNNNALDNLYWRFNSDTAANYSSTRLLGDGSSATSDRRSNDTAIYGGLNNTVQGVITAQIMNYANTTTYKTMLLRSNNNGYVSAEVSLWRKTPEAINSITIYQVSPSQFVTGSTFTLYGIKAA